MSARGLKMAPRRSTISPRCAPHGPTTAARAHKSVPRAGQKDTMSALLSLRWGGPTEGSSSFLAKGLSTAPRGPSGTPKEPQECPQIPQTSPEMAPRRPNIAPRGPH
eukprot:2347312-Pyramimonas_sp.AAC.1